MKPKKKPNHTAAKRQAQQEQQKKKMQRIMWISGACIVVLVILLIVLQPGKGEENTAGEISAENTVNFNYDQLPRLGSADAPVKIVEFGDFKCPSCQWFSQNIIPQLELDYVDEGHASVYYMNYLIISPNGGSRTAALAAQSVYHQNPDEFWRYMKSIYDHQGDERAKEWATVDFLVDLAKQENIAVDYELLEKDIKKKTYNDELNEQIKLANSLKLGGTPSVYINGKPYVDPQGISYANIKAMIDAELEATTQTEE